MTGNFPAIHRIHRHFPESAEKAAAWGMPLWLDNKVTLLPRLLQQAGYKTAHYGKWHLTNRPFKQAPLPISYGYDDAKCFNDQLDDWKKLKQRRATYSRACWLIKVLSSSIKMKETPFLSIFGYTNHIRLFMRQTKCVKFIQIFKNRI